MYNGSKKYFSKHSYRAIHKGLKGFYRDNLQRLTKDPKDILRNTVIERFTKD
jgi:hypothetical protein